MDFFKEYIYNDFKDIIEQKNTKQHIFRKQILNDNLFGKLTIFPTGEVYSNVNFPTIRIFKIKNCLKLFILK